MKIFNKIYLKISRAMNILSGALLVALMVFVVVYVVLRALGHPIFGTFEIIQLGSLIIVTLALGYNEFCDGNISVDTLYVKLGAGGKRAFDIISCIINSVISCIAAYCEIVYIFDRFKSGAHTDNLMIPVWIFIVILSVGLVVLAIGCIFKTIAYITGYERFTEEPSKKIAEQ